MKILKVTALIFATAWMTSCAPTAPVGNVEALERQAPITPEPNSVGNALHGRNAVDYSNGQSYPNYNRGYNRYGY